MTAWDEPGADPLADLQDYIWKIREQGGREFYVREKAKCTHGCYTDDGWWYCLICNYIPKGES